MKIQKQKLLNYIELAVQRIVEAENDTRKNTIEKMMTVKFCGIVIKRISFEEAERIYNGSVAETLDLGKWACVQKKLEALKFLLTIADEEVVEISPSDIFELWKWEN